MLRKNGLRSIYFCLSTVVIALTLSGCLQLPGQLDPNGTPTPSPSPTPAATPPVGPIFKSCLPPEDFSQSLEATLKLTLPKPHKDKRVKGNEFWNWYVNRNASRVWGREIVFNGLSTDLSRVQLNQEVLSVETLVLNTDNIRWDRLILGVNGVKGTQTDASAIKVETLESFELEPDILVPYLLLLIVDGGVNPTEGHGWGFGRWKNEDLFRFVRIRSFDRVRLTIDLKKFSFGGVTTIDDLVREAANENHALKIRMRHIDGFFRNYYAQLNLKGVNPGDCPQPTPPPEPTPPQDTTAPVVRIVSQAISGLTTSTSQSLQFAADEPVSFRCSFDQTQWTDCAKSGTLSEGEWTGSSLTDGDHQLAVQAVDTVGNESAIVFVQWSIDTKAPALNLVSVTPSTTQTNSTSFEMAFSANETVQFTCTIDGAASQSCQSPLALNGLSDGAHRVEVVATDLVGLASSPLVHEWEVLIIPPSAQITSVSPLKNPVASDTISFEFSGGARTKGFLCKLDEAPASACSSPMTYSGLSDGAHLFQVQAVDALGQAGEPGTYAWTIDTLAPEAFILSLAPAQSPTSSATMEISFGATESSMFECLIDQGLASGCESPVKLESLGEGEHEILFWAVDPAGNKSAPVRHTWIIDRTAPQISFTRIEPADALINSTSVQLSFVANESANWECRLDEGVFAACTSPVTFASLGDGDHAVEVRATDLASNPSSVLRHVFKVDTAKPFVQITESLPAALVTSSRGRQFSFTANEAVNVFECQLDSGEFKTCSSPVAYENLAEGAHTFIVRARDLAGNENADPATAAWRIDLTAPESQLTAKDPEDSPTDSTSMVLQFTSTEAEVTFECQRDGLGYSRCDSPFVLNNLADGDHSFDVRAVDAAGNSDASPATYSWKVDTSPLTISAISYSGITKNSINIAWSTNRAASSQLEFTEVATGVTQTAPLDPQLVTSHRSSLTGLKSFTLYSVTVMSRSASGQTVRGTPFTFRTTR